MASKTTRSADAIKREAGPLNERLARLNEAWRTTMWREDLGPAEFERLKAAYERERDEIDDRLIALDHEWQAARRRKNPEADMPTDPYAMTAPAKLPYLRAMDAAEAWVTSPFDFRGPRSPLRRFMEGIPRDPFVGESVDRDEWLGEIFGNILHAIEADPALTPTQRRELEAVMEMRIDRRYQARGRSRSNPAPTRAIAMFRRFHTRDWRGEGDFHPALEIPDQAICLGDAVNVLYASDKLNPTDGSDEGWIDYIHEHSSGVRAYCAPGRSAPAGDLVTVPAWIRNADQLTWLGRCLGFAYRDEGGRERKAKGTQPLPELYTVPSGKALLVIQSKRTLLALIWGGRLGVERRGIVH